MKSRFACAAAVIALPAAALASGDGHGPDHTLWVYLVDFLILAVPVAILVGPRIRKHLAARSDDVRTRIAEAETAFAEAETRMRAAEERIARLNAEIDSLLAEFTDLGAAERDALAADGEVLATKVRDETDFRISQAIKMARTELATEVVAQAFDQVERRLAERAGGPVADRTVEGLVAGVRAADPA